MSNTSAEIPAMLADLRAVQATGRTRPLAWRLEQLEGLERMLAEEEARFSTALRSDLGKSAAESWLTEISFVAGAARYARKHLRGWMKDQAVATPAPLKPGRSWIHHEPLGTVLIIAPWNYPLQLCLAPLITAVSAGNCAVIKPSELAPATAAALAECLPRYVDGDCIRVVEGGVEESTALLEQPFDHIVFTGGERVARIVMAAAARHLTPVTLELGGKSPCVVLPDADLDITARRIAWGKFTNAGQTCIAPDYILCSEETQAKLVPRLTAEIQRMFGADPAGSADYGRIVNTSHWDRLEQLRGGQQAVMGGPGDRAERYLPPTILTGVDADDAVMQEEIFGPILPILNVDGLATAIEFIRARPKPLAAYLFSKDSDCQDRLLTEVSAGSVCLNDVLVFLAVEQLPFSGVGPSGHGSYKGEEGFRRLSHRKAVLKRGWWPDFRLRYAPYTAAKMSWLRRLR